MYWSLILSTRQIGKILFIIVAIKYFFVQQYFCYLCNMYNMTLVEIIEYTFVGEKFTIVAVFMRHEDEDHYTWVLNNVKIVDDQGVEPGAIAIDRELGQLKRNVFLNSYNLFVKGT